ncbi:MAG: HAD-IC family P-type ATPase, partial [Clostridia bacterium]|nr:HAD-IC family P-type ATPase [Clostridia bacterium]
ITSNVFTFFNLLCIVCIIALLVVRAPLLNYTFAITYIFNLAIGIIQELKAKKTIEKLSIMNESTALVLRDGRYVEILNSNIVMDEIIKFRSGNQISVDCTVLEGHIEVNESLLTGESASVRKTAGDKLFAGSFAVGGSAVCVADKVGEERYIQILSAKAKKFSKPSSELLRTLQGIIRAVGLLIVPIGVSVFLTNYYVVTNENPFTSFTRTGVDWVTVITHTTPAFIGMIPAGMFLLTTLALTVGVIRLASKQTSVQDMYALERLARADVLCLDKTGTITDGKMKVTDCIVFDKSSKYSLNDVISSMQNVLGDNNHTSAALKNYFGRERVYTPIKTIPFSSERKFSAVTFTDENDGYFTFALGAPDFVMAKDTLPKTVCNLIEKYSSAGQRVLLLAISDEKIVSDAISKTSLKPFALIVLSDTIRQNVIKTIEWFKQNDVQIKVISGDNPATVSEVAKRAGVENADKYISLEGLSNSEIIDAATKYNVFGRVSPEQKALLIKSIKAAGHTVAMTGDGVNDILAMKESDCSITIATGSDATKNIAHLVLMNNDFNSLPSVVAEGRRVINNIERSSSLYLMKTLSTAILAILSVVFRQMFPFTNQMMIPIEMIVIGIGSFALSMQSNTNRVQGKFVSYVFAHAIPGAAILMLNIFAFQILRKFPIGMAIDDKYFETLVVSAQLLGGMIYLGIICKPFNLFRTVLVLSLSALSVAWICFFMPVFSLPGLFADFGNNWQYILMLACIVQFDVTLGKFLTMITERLSSAPKL